MSAHLVDQPAHHVELGREIERLLDWSAASLVDGRVHWLTDGGRPDPVAGQQLWLTTRMAHVLCLGQLMGRRADGDLADQALDAIDADFLDRRDGGWFSRSTPSGGLDTTKSAYGHVFVLLAASSAVVAGRAAGGNLLDRAIDVVVKHFWDDEAGLLVESWNRDWTTCEPYRGANANMHAVEAFLAVADATQDQLWRDRASRIAHRVAGQAEAHGWRIPEHFDPDWTPILDYNFDQPRHPFRPYGATPGHAFEWSRLLIQLGGEWATRAANKLFAQAILDAWDHAHGGFPYTTDWAGQPVVSGRFHWVHCEALAAAVALWRQGEDPWYADWYEQIWIYTWSRFPASDGGWRHELDPAGRVSTHTWSGRPDTYHAVQACLMPMLPIDRGFASGVSDPRAFPWAVMPWETSAGDDSSARGSGG